MENSFFKSWEQNCVAFNSMSGLLEQAESDAAALSLQTSVTEIIDIAYKAGQMAKELQLVNDSRPVSSTF